MQTLDIQRCVTYFKIEDARELQDIDIPLGIK